MSSQFKSEKDRFRLHSDDGRDAGPSHEYPIDPPPDGEPDAASPHDVHPDQAPGPDYQLGPMSEETKARYSELLIALEQTITRAVEQPEAAPRIPRSAGADEFERDFTRLQAEPPQANRVPPVRSPFAPPNLRPFRPELPAVEPRPLEPLSQSLVPERRPALDYDAIRRREETIAGLKSRTRPHPLAARQQLAAQDGQHSAGWGLLRRIAFAGVATGAVILLGAVYLSYASHAPNTALAAVTPSLLQRVINGGGDRQPAGHVTWRMVLTDLSGPKNRPIALGVTVEAPPAGASVVVKGMPTGSRLTSGTAIGGGAWRIPMRDMTRAAVIPPADYVGPMNLAVDLRLADDTVADSDVLRLEWTAAAAEGMVPKSVKTTVITAGGNQPPAPSAPSAPPPAAATDASGAMAALAAAPVRSSVPRAEQQQAPPRSVSAPVVRHLDQDEIATLVERGEGFLQNGDTAAARLLLRRAADAGHAQAAMALAATYDPVMLKEFGVLGVVPNVATARLWYERASQLGSAEAQRRLLQLAQQSQ